MRRYFLQIKPGTDIYIFLAIMHIIIRDGLADEAFIAARTEGYEDFREMVKGVHARDGVVAVWRACWRRLRQRRGFMRMVNG